MSGFLREVAIGGPTAASGQWQVLHWWEVNCRTPAMGVLQFGVVVPFPGRHPQAVGWFSFTVGGVVCEV